MVGRSVLAICFVVVAHLVGWTDGRRINAEDGSLYNLATLKDVASRLGKLHGEAAATGLMQMQQLVHDVTEIDGGLVSTPGRDEIVGKIIKVINETLKPIIKSAHTDTQAAVDQAVQSLANKTQIAVAAKSSADLKDLAWIDCVSEEKQLLEVVEERVNSKEGCIEVEELLADSFRCTATLCQHEYRQWKVRFEEALQECDEATRDSMNNWLEKRQFCIEKKNLRNAAMCEFDSKYKSKCAAKARYYRLVEQVSKSGNSHSEIDRITEFNTLQKSMCLLNYSMRNVQHSCEPDYNSEIGMVHKKTDEVLALISDENFSCLEESYTFYNGSTWKVPHGLPPDPESYVFGSSFDSSDIGFCKHDVIGMWCSNDKSLKIQENSWSPDVPDPEAEYNLDEYIDLVEIIGDQKHHHFARISEHDLVVHTTEVDTVALHRLGMAIDTDRQGLKCGAVVDDITLNPHRTVLTKTPKAECLQKCMDDDDCVALTHNANNVNNNRCILCNRHLYAGWGALKQGGNPNQNDIAYAKTGTKTSLDSTRNGGVCASGALFLYRDVNASVAKCKMACERDENCFAYSAYFGNSKWCFGCRDDLINDKSDDNREFRFGTAYRKFGFKPVEQIPNNDEPYVGQWIDDQGDFHNGALIHISKHDWYPFPVTNLTSHYELGKGTDLVVHKEGTHYIHATTLSLNGSSIQLFERQSRGIEIMDSCTA